MSDVIRHRGPDDEGFVLFKPGVPDPCVLGGRDTPAAAFSGGLPYSPAGDISTHVDGDAIFGLAHRRLAILDVSPRGHQPMCSPGRRIWISYNGEVYNFVELRSELENLGHRFITRSDTEVILAAYAQWGTDCLNRFNGMWAFAIYDGLKDELFLSRDRFGIKPLYYWLSPDGAFCFGSEIKQFTRFPGFSARVNGQRAYDFLAWGLTDHTSDTLFEGVHQVPPGHFMRLAGVRSNRGSVSLAGPTKWYELKAAPFPGSFDDAVGEFRSRLTDAVRLHMRADVPVGSCLSGGLDSSSIVCLVNELLRAKECQSLQHTFSASSRLGRFDETRWINEVASALQITPKLVCPELGNLFDELPTIAWHQDEPFGSTSIYAQWSVFALAAQHGIKVMLDGQGADEQLAGYHGYFGARFASLFRAGRFMRLWNEIQATKKVHGYSEARSLKYMANVLLPDVIRQPLRALNGKAHSTPAWLEFRSLGAQPGDPLAALGNYSGTIRDMSQAQLSSTHLQMLLHWEDRDSMAHSIESRVPYLDFRLVEFVLGLPDEFKLSDGITKRVQREGMKNVLPPSISQRMDKIGFATPEEVWLRQEAPDVFRRKLTEAIAISEGILNEHGLRMFDEIVAGRRPYDSTPWRLISFGEWIKAFSVRGH